MIKINSDLCMYKYTIKLLKFIYFLNKTISVKVES